MRLKCFASWRNIQKMFELWSHFFALPTPNFTTIRQWFLKLGLFELRRPKERRNDWIFIIDTVFGQGDKRCFVILGLTYEKWQSLYNPLLGIRSALTHQDVSVLEIAVLNSTKSSILTQKIEDLAQTVGQPLQIISDRGPDIKKSIELYVAKHPSTLHTFDFTHHVALYLKHTLENDQRWIDFLDLTNFTRLACQMTNLCFLIPPRGRSKARYHNVDILIDWGLNILKYWRKQDFSLIDSRYYLSYTALKLIKNQILPESFLKLQYAYCLPPHNDYNSWIRFLVSEKDLHVNENFNLITDAANLAKTDFLYRYGWLLRSENYLITLRQVIQVFSHAKYLLQNSGLNRDSLSQWLLLEPQFLSDPEPEVHRAIIDVRAYLTLHSGNISNQFSFPATSDIIESLFGKFKRFSETSAFSEINEMVLSLILSTIDITFDKIKQAMETITNNDVIDWVKSTFGQSQLSKRKQAFSNS